ncbi:MAG TPA: hypothetical protein VF459_18505 [Caulobacteraceae bacterium]
MRPLLAITLAAAVLAAATAAQAAQTVYDDALAPGWSSWSWAKVSLANAAPAHSGGASIAVDAAPWSALYLSHAPMDLSGFKTLTFWVHGGAKGGQSLSVVAVVGGKALTDHFVRVVPHAGTWTEVSVPIAKLGVGGKAIDGLWIQNGSGEALETFYVDDISLQ